MDLPQYQLKAEKSLMVFEFISEGTKGRIPKLVKYSDTNLKDLYNLAFGDKDIKTGIIDDSIISNNGDSEKVLATVVATIYAFTDRYPDAWIYATGSTKSRTRLYRIGISKYMEEVKQNFEVLGLKNRGWHPFKRDEDYEAFLVR
jgi:hypothetical protein